MIVANLRFGEGGGVLEDVLLELFVGAEEDGLGGAVVDVQHLEEEAEDHGDEEELIHLGLCFERLLLAN